MPKRNYGFPESDGQRYPNGCDWQKPPGCTCRFYAQAQGCENRCDDSLWEVRESGLMKYLFNVIVAILVVVFGLVVINKAFGTELSPIPFLQSAQLPRVAPVERAPVAVAAPSVPFYCKPLLRFERSCVGVKAAAVTFGKSRARALALRCGATPEEIQHAESCFEK
jgi:hypothetical protein